MITKIAIFAIFAIAIAMLSGTAFAQDGIGQLDNSAWDVVPAGAAPAAYYGGSGSAGYASPSYGNGGGSYYASAAFSGQNGYMYVTAYGPGYNMYPYYSYDRSYFPSQSYYPTNYYGGYGYYSSYFSYPDCYRSCGSAASAFVPTGSVSYSVKTTNLVTTRGSGVGSTGSASLAVGRDARSNGDSGPKAQWY